MAFSTVTVGLTSTLSSGNTSPVSLTVTLTTTDYPTIAQFVQNVHMNGGLFTDSKHWIPINAIQYLDIS